MIDDEIQHQEPAWKTKGNYAIGAKIKDPTWSELYSHEQLAAVELEDGTFMLCCIPFALYDLCLGDIVAVDNDLYVKEVVRRSDYIGFRVATESRDSQAEMFNYIREISHEVEIYSGRLTALAADNAIDGKRLANALQQLEDNGTITAYETIDS